MNIFKNRKFKYGSLSVIFTAVFIAAIIVLNIIVTVLASSLYWFADMTPEHKYQISDLSDKLLANVNDKITITFMNDEDEISSSSSMKEIYELVKLYEKNYKFVNVNYIDPVAHPEQVQKYLKHTVAATLNNTDVVFEGPSGQYKIVGHDAFYSTDSESGKLYAFAGERKITTTILSLYSNNSIAYITTGHGENVKDITELRNLLEIVGFEVRDIDLSKEDIDKKAKIIIINSPKTDFLGVSDSVDEIKKLDTFLDNFGHLMVFLDGEYQTPELESLLGDWGIQFNHDIVTESADRSLSVDGRTLWATYTEDGIGSQLHSSIRKLESVPKTVLEKAQTLTIKDLSKSDKDTSPVLVTSKDATKFDVLNADSKSAAAPGEALMVLSEDTTIIKSTDNYYTYILACGTSDFISDKYLSSNKYGNKDILYSALRIMVQDNVDVDTANINFAVYESQGLDITTAQANKWLIVTTIAVPVMILIFGTAVYIRRRHL